MCADYQSSASITFLSASQEALYMFYTLRNVMIFI